MPAPTLALVGATGGAGTTRTAVELAAVGARAGHDVTVIDAAYATQGLSAHVTGRIGTDLTTVLTDDPDAALSAATYPLSLPEHAGDLDGRAVVVPARAPFERIARAKTAAAAQSLETRITEAAAASDAVILDTPPVASNQAVAAATATDRVAVVHPATETGRDARARLNGRLADVGASVDVTVAVQRDETRDPADAAVDVLLGPTDPHVDAAPTAATGDGAYTEAVAELYELVFATTLGLSFDRGGVIDRLTR